MTAGTCSYLSLYEHFYLNISVDFISWHSLLDNTHIYTMYADTDRQEILQNVSTKEIMKNKISHKHTKTALQQNRMYSVLVLCISFTL